MFGVLNLFSDSNTSSVLLSTECHLVKGSHLLVEALHRLHGHRQAVLAAEAAHSSLRSSLVTQVRISLLPHSSKEESGHSSLLTTCWGSHGGGRQGEGEEGTGRFTDYSLKYRLVRVRALARREWNTLELLSGYHWKYCQDIPGNTVRVSLEILRRFTGKLDG